MVIFFKVNRNIKSMDRRQTVENRIKHTKQKKEEHNRVQALTHCMRLFVQFATKDSTELIHMTKNCRSIFHLTFRTT